jgi:antitoxin component HigA of HigAB toxin-antitoxin module
MALPKLEIEISADPTAADVGFKKIERSLDGLEKATRDYQVALNKINAAEKAGVITSKAAAAAVRGAEQAYESAARAAAQYSGAQVNMRRASVEAAQALDQVSRSSRFGGSQLQNIGFQVGDFATQVGAGTSATQALGQQLPQLLGGFGALGAVMGAVAAIGIPLGAALLSVGGEAKTLEEQLDALAEAMDAVNAAQDRFTVSAADLRAEFGAQAEAAREVLAAQREIANLMAERALSSATADLAEQFGDLNAMVSDTGEVLRGGYEEVLRRILRTTDATANEAMELANALNGLSKAEGPEAQRAALERVKQALLEATGGVQNMDEETLKVYQSLLDAELAAARLAQLDISSNITTAADEAQRLKEELWAAAAMDYARSSGRYSGRGGDPRQFDTEGRLGGGFVPSQDIIDQANEILNPKKGRKKKDQPDRIGALAQSLMTESEMLENWRSESITKLEEFNQLELEALGGHAEAKLRLEEEYLERLGKMQQQEADKRFAVLQGSLGAVSSLFSSFANLQDAEGKKSFEKQKKLRKAAAIVEGISAGVAAWRTGMEQGGLPLAALYTAASAAKTGAQIAAIDRQSYSGGNASSVSTGASTSAGSAPAIPTQTVAINLQGDTFSRGSVEGLLEQIQSQLDRGGRLVFS